MAIQIPNLGSGNGLTGDNELVIRQKYNANFSDRANAASRLVGSGTGNVMEVGAFGLGSTSDGYPNFGRFTIAGEDSAPSTPSYQQTISVNWDTSGKRLSQILLPLNGDALAFRKRNVDGNWGTVFYTYHTGNTTKDSNGFIKGASPIVDLYSDRIELNEDAQKQNPIFEKVSTGSYLVKGSLGFAQEGWYIETPKDANGNVLVAVTYEQLANKDISVKTYAKKFDEDTGDIVANLTKPRDIPAGRFISLRLHELPAEPALPSE